MQDLDNSFLNVDDFGEVVTLRRGDNQYSVKGLYDELPLNGEDMGAGVDAISHNPRLFVSASSLPNGFPKKGDKFDLESNEFHSSKKLVAKDFEFPKDGVVVYYLKERNGS